MFILAKKGHSEFAHKSFGTDTRWNDMIQRWLNWLLWEMYISNKKCSWNPQHAHETKHTSGEYNCVLERPLQNYVCQEVYRTKLQALEMVLYILGTWTNEFAESAVGLCAFVDLSLPEWSAGCEFSWKYLKQQKSHLELQGMSLWCRSASSVAASRPRFSTSSLPSLEGTLLFQEDSWHVKPW
jgi:hypothetical protein